MGQAESKGTSLQSPRHQYVSAHHPTDRAGTPPKSVLMIPTVTTTETSPRHQRRRRQSIGNGEIAEISKSFEYNKDYVFKQSPL